MKDSKVTTNVKRNYAVVPGSIRQSVRNILKLIPPEERNFSKWISGLPHGNFDNCASTFQGKYLALTEEDGVTPLHKACTRGDLEQVKLLCDTSTIETRDKYNNRPFDTACIWGDLRIVEYLHQHGCDIEAPGYFDTLPLHLAAKQGRLDVVKYLCSQNCQLDIPTENMWRPIHLACKFGHTEIVRYLCEQGCSKEVLTDLKEQPLHITCEQGHMEIVRLLCEQNCDIEATTSNNNRPIHLACEHGHLEIVRLLCEQNCDLEATTSNNNRPIHLACEHGHLEIVRLLCEQNCDIEATTSNNNRPIHLACEHGHLEIARLLCEQNCDIEATTSNNNRPIHLACEHGHLEIARLLCEQNCDIEATTSNNNRPIHLACEHGHLEIVMFLCEQKLDIEAPGCEDNRPMHYACEHGHLDIVKLLCQQKGDMEATTLDDKRPIHFACEHGHLNIVKFLCDKKCNIEATTLDDKRPIHFACEHGHLEIVKFLCQQKCDMEATTLDDNRPIHFACEQGYMNIVKFLCQQKCDMESKREDGYSPIKLAHKYNRMAIVKYLSERKKHIQDSDTYQTLDTSYSVQQRSSVEAFTTMDISALPDESAERQLVQKISNMNFECDVSCDHSSCLQSILSNGTKIGMGAFGIVYKVTDPQLNYTYCIKSIYLDPKARIPKPKHIEPNIEKYLQHLHHERIVQYFAMKTKPEKMFIFMEYVEGIPLNQHINKKPLPHNKVIQFSKEILEGLKFLHQNKIIHRDIKPGNLMLNTDDHVKLCDFGISCYLESIGLGSEIQTADSSTKMTFCGTVSYMAPELVSGERYSYPVDIWALGASVVEMLTGKPPFHRMQYFEVIFKIGNAKKIEFDPAEPMSEEMKSFVDQMLCPCPLKRATAETLLKYISHAFSI